MNLKHISLFAAVVAIGLMGCDPHMEDSLWFARQTHR